MSLRKVDSVFPGNGAKILSHGLQEGFRQLESRLETGVTGASPPTVTSMGSSFYLGWLIPRETSLVIWGSERDKSLNGQDDGFLSQITAKKDSQEEDIPLDGTCLRDKTNKLKVCTAVVSTSRYQ